MYWLKFVDYLKITMNLRLYLKLTFSTSVHSSERIYWNEFFFPTVYTVFLLCARHYFRGIIHD